MKSATIYPFNRNTYSVLNYISSAKSLTFYIRHIVPLKGWESNCEYVFGNIELKPCYDIKKCIIDSDILCIVETWADISFREYIYPAVQFALSVGKQVLFTTVPSLENRRLIEAIPCEHERIYFPESIPPAFGHFVNITTPVLAIGGYSAGLDKLSVELNLTREFRNRGYDVLLVASNPVVGLWGDSFIPSYIFSNSVTENEKIRAFNYYISNLESLHKPDLIILGIPGAIVSNDPESLMDFGVISFELSLAVKIDEIVLVSPYFNYNSEYFSMIEGLVERKLGSHILRHHISRLGYDFSTMREMSHISPFLVNENEVKHIVEKISIDNVANLNDPRDIQELCDEFINKYSSYADVGFF